MVAASSGQLSFPNNLGQQAFNISASGDSTLLAGAAGKQVRVYRMKLVTAAATTLIFKDGSRIIDGPYVFANAASMVLDFTTINMPPWYITSVGNDLVINNANAVQLGGNLDYLIS